MAALLVGAVGFAQQAVAATGISTTKHNLGSGGTGVNKVSGTDEICVFCHTPHASNSSAAAVAAAPLWNKALPASTYLTYSTTGNGGGSLDGEVIGVGSISLACLSCHDGTQAMDNMMNAPGSGGYNSAGATQSGYTWSGANQTNGMINSVANLGVDLKNDHPIGIQYCGGGQTAALPSGACKDTDFKAPATGTVNSAQVWWVDTEATGNGTRQKTDMALYKRTFASADGPSVECGSCHDPHSTNATFLRIANTGSAVCLACHVK